MQYYTRCFSQHVWCGDKTKYDETVIEPRVLAHQITNAERYKRKRERERLAVLEAEERAEAEEQLAIIRAEQVELLQRAKKWFSQGAFTKTFYAWKNWVRNNQELRANARCNGKGCCVKTSSLGGLWPFSCRCCCCKLPPAPKPPETAVKLKRWYHSCVVQ